MLCKILLSFADLHCKTIRIENSGRVYHRHFQEGQCLNLVVFFVFFSKWNKRGWFAERENVCLQNLKLFNAWCTNCLCIRSSYWTNRRGPFLHSPCSFNSTNSGGCAANEQAISPNSTLLCSDCTNFPQLDFTCDWAVFSFASYERWVNVPSFIRQCYYGH